MPMRLPLDENISWRLVAYLRPHCAAVLHVCDTSLDAPILAPGAAPNSPCCNVLTKPEDCPRLVLAE